VNFNTRSFIENCLRSIFSCPFAGKSEVIVVDNNSTDGSVEVLRRNFLGVRLIRNQVNVGFAVANNQGLKIATGKYILLLNPDTEILSDALDILYRFIVSHPEAAIVAPMLVDGGHKRQPSCRRFPSVWQEMVKAIGFPKYLPDHPLFGFSNACDYRSAHKIDQPQGACLLARRDALEEDCVFDGRFYMYYEEVDLCYRMRKRGWEIYFVPEARVIHFSGKSFSKNMPRMIFHIYRSKFLFFKKHYGIVTQSLVYFLTIVEMVYRGAIYSFIGLFHYKRRREIKLRLKGYIHVLSRFSAGRISE
jgi:GT2 family glycosyltransferase